MADEVLELLIQELLTAIDGSAGLDREEKDHLIGLVKRVGRRIEDEHGGIVEQIEDTVSRFETDHVALVGTLNRIANVLSAGGI